MFFISYIRSRDKIPYSKRDKFEKWLIFSVIVLLLVNIFILMNERREIANEMDDCVRFYQYFPYFQNDSDFYFVRERCYEYLTKDEIAKIRERSLNRQNPLNLNFKFWKEVYKNEKGES